jgi:uncharacterized protein (DUF302 family)
MIEIFTGIYRTHVTPKSFNDAVSALETAIGNVAGQAFADEVKTSTNAGDFERRMHAQESTSGFMLFHVIDHGAWMRALGLDARSRMYTIGNPLIARTMTKFDAAVGLHVPVRICIFEDNQGRTNVSYVLPSSLMSAFKNSDVQAAAAKLDAKLISLAEHVAGVSA